MAAHNSVKFITRAVLGWADLALDIQEMGY